MREPSAGAADAAELIAQRAKPGRAAGLPQAAHDRVVHVAAMQWMGMADDEPGAGAVEQTPLQQELGFAARGKRDRAAAHATSGAAGSSDAAGPSGWMCVMGLSAAAGMASTSPASRS